MAGYPRPVIKAQDILVLLKLAVSNGRWTFFQLASELGLGVSTVHRSLDRAAHAGLYNPATEKVNTAALIEFLVHGGKYVFPPILQGEARGFPTAWGVPPLADRLSRGAAPAPVWAHPRGSARGIALAPIHPKAPEVSRKDARVGELLALFDAIRIGKARERELAAKLLRKRLEMKRPPA